jgi:hypothetical protein
MRLAPINAITGALLDFSTSSDVKEWALGTPLAAVGTDYDTTSNVANWGEADLLYVSSVAAAAILPGTLVVLDKNFRIAATAASEANTGRPVFVALTAFQIGSTTEQYGWVLRRGICPVAYSVAATTGNMYGGTAGEATPTAAAGVQILNARCLIAAVSTFTRSVLTRTGSSTIKNLSSVAGIYVGQAISGTGIPASSVVSAIDPNGTWLTIGSAVGTPVNATASGGITATFTNTGYGICEVNFPTFQSQIT